MSMYSTWSIERPKPGCHLVAVQINIQSIFVVTTAVKLELAIFDVTIQDDKKIIVIVTTEDFKRSS